MRVKFVDRRVFAQRLLIDLVDLSIGRGLRAAPQVDLTAKYSGASLLRDLKQVVVGGCNFIAD